VTVRDLRAEDWPSVRAIYEDGIRSGATFETEPPSWEAWDASHPELRLVASATVHSSGGRPCPRIPPAAAIGESAT
jgi:L-amino acid N-acyltransferase YncA